MNIRSLEFVCSAIDSSAFPKDSRLEVAVCGRSNVGKSSLLNSILGRKNFARSSQEPGKTRTINFLLINESFYLVDLPGYGYAKISMKMRETLKKALFGYITGRRNLKGVIQLIDSRHPPTRDDIDMLQTLVDSERPFMVVLAKADKIRRSERRLVIENLSSCFEGISVGLSGGENRDGGSGLGSSDFEVPAIFFSSKTGEGKRGIWRWIERKAVRGGRGG